MSRRYWIPVSKSDGTATKVHVSVVHYDVALEWLRFDTPVFAEEAYPSGMDWYHAKRAWSNDLAGGGVLNSTPTGYILAPAARQHLRQGQGRGGA